MRLDPRADVLAERLDIGRHGPAEVEQEIAMLVRNLRVAAAQAPAAGGVDQRPRLRARRILEGRSAGAAAQRLARLALGGDAVHLGADDGGIAGHALEQRLDHHRALGQRRMTIGISEPRRWPGLDRARAQHQRRLDQQVGDVAAVSAGVHPHRAAHRARNPAQELEPGDAGVARRRGDADAHRRGAGAHAFVVLDRHLGETLRQAHDHARHAAVAHDQVRADADRHDGDGGIERRDEIGQIGDVGRPDEPLGLAAGAEPDEVGERRVGLNRTA